MELNHYYYSEYRRRAIPAIEAVKLAREWVAPRFPSASYLDILHSNLRLFYSRQHKSYAATCGKDGISNRVYVPRYHAFGESPRAAYLALAHFLRCYPPFQAPRLAWQCNSSVNLDLLNEYLKR